MPINRSGTAVLSDSGGTTTTSTTATLASTTPGDYNIVVVSANTSGGTSPDPATTCTGGSGSWTVLAGSWKTGSPSHRLAAFGKFYVAGDPNPTIGIAALGNIKNAAVAYAGVDLTTPVVSGEAAAQAQGSSSTAFTTPSVITAGSRWLISAAGDRTSATTWTGTDSLLLTGAVASAANLIVQDSNGAIASGSYSRTLTASVGTSVGNALIIALNPAATSSAASGTVNLAFSTSSAASGPGTAGTATFSLSAAGAAPSAGAAGSVALSLTTASTASSPAQAWVRGRAGGGQIMAHRNGVWGTYGEETLEGYSAAAAYHSGLALEISVWDTSDGVYVCSHDSTTGRVFSGTNRTINATAWATFSPNGASTTGRPTTLTGGNPLRRLEEILDAFPGRVFAIENKHGTNMAGLADLLDARAPGRWLFKGPYNDTANALVAAGRGAPLLLYFYPSQLSGLATTYAAVSGAGVPLIFGLADYSAAPVPVQIDADTFFAFTKPRGLYTCAHVLGTSTQKTTADAQAAVDSAAYDGYMLSNAPAIIATDATSAASGTIGLAFSAAGVGRSPASGSVGLTFTATAGASSPAGGTVGLSLAVGGQAAAAASGAVSLTLTAGGALTPPAAGGTVSFALGLGGTPSGPAAGTVGLFLAASGALNSPTASGAVGLAFTTVSGTGAPSGGTVGFTFTAAGSSTAPSAGLAAFALSLSGSSGGALPATGSVNLAFSTTGGGRGLAGGSVGLTFAVSAGAAGPGGGTAAFALALGGSGAARAAGSVALSFTPSGAGQSPAAGAFGAVLALSGAAQAGGLPPDVTVIVGSVEGNRLIGRVEA